MAATMAATALLMALWAGAGCTHAGGKLMVDAPQMLPYQAPDIDEITGIDSEEAEEDEDAAPGAGSGSAQAPHK
jgi:hypothetical protein